MAAEQTKISELEHQKILYGKMDADDFRDYILVSFLQVPEY
jgi:hypothetical protein